MNTAQRTVLFGTVLVIIAMCAFPPCKNYASIEYISLWHMYWFGTRPILMSFLLGQIAIVLILTTLLTLAFKTKTRRFPV